MTTVEVERLQESFRERLGRSPVCPDSGRIWDALAGELDSAETRSIVEHSAECAECAVLWRLAKEIGAMEERGAAVSPRRSWTPLLAAAVVVVAVAGLWVVLKPGPASIPPEFRAGASDEIRSLTDESVPLARSAAVLEWTGPEGATYMIRVATEDLQPVGGGYALSEGRYAIPESALEALPPETILVWQVEAHLEGGGLITSRAFLARIE